MMMISKKKATAMILGLTMGISGTAMAAPNDDTDINARIAALEAQQQKLSKQLNALKKENAKLKRTSKVAESNKNAIKGLKEVQNRFQLHGFARASWDDDNIRGYIDRNDNRRTYLDLKGKFIVNDKWNVNFESETNHRYAKYLDADGNYKSHFGHDDEDGVIQRAWVEGRVGPVSLDVGRRWRGLGFQNVLFGNESDGLVLETAIPKSKLSAKLVDLQANYAIAHDNSQKMRDMHDKLTTDIKELETRKETIKGKIAVAKAQEKINKMTSNVANANNSIASFERYEQLANKRMDKAQAVAELNASNPANSIKDLTAKYINDPNVDAELEALKASLGMATPTELPQ